jgi:taurine dioxygenase
MPSSWRTRGHPGQRRANPKPSRFHGPTKPRANALLGVAEGRGSAESATQRMRAAYDALSLEMKERLAGRAGLHGRSSGPAGERLYGDDKGVTERVYTELPRPAVVRHPVTGRQILFVNPMHTHGFEGMRREEAWQLIEELEAHSTQERFVYYHRWRVGDVLMWDERATMHRGAGDYQPEERRIMLRTIVYPY